MSNSEMNDVNAEDELVRIHDPLDALGTDDEDDTDVVGHGFADGAGADDVPDTVGGAGTSGDVMGGTDGSGTDAVGGRDTRDADLMSDDE